MKNEKYSGALIFADHHPPYTAGGKTGWSVELLSQIDQICESVGVWPHAFLSGHAHNYQRFTRTRNADKTQIPYIICGNGGHNVVPLAQKGAPALRTPQVIQAAQGKNDLVVFENYDDQDYGYLRIIASAAQLRIEYHPASDGTAAKTPDDFVTVDLASRTLVQYSANDLGMPAAARAREEAEAKEQAQLTRRRVHRGAPCVKAATAHSCVARRPGVSVTPRGP